MPKSVTDLEKRVKQIEATLAKTLKSAEQREKYLSGRIVDLQKVIFATRKAMHETMMAVSGLRTKEKEVGQRFDALDRFRGQHLQMIQEAGSKAAALERMADQRFDALDRFRGQHLELMKAAGAKTEALERTVAAQEQAIRSLSTDLNGLRRLTEAGGRRTAKA